MVHFAQVTLRHWQQEGTKTRITVETSLPCKHSRFKCRVTHQAANFISEYTLFLLGSFSVFAHVKSLQAIQREQRLLF